MKFMTPEKYTKTQEGHFVINTNAVNQFVEIYGPLDCKDKVLDFGSGTGETTAAMAQVRNDSKEIHRIYVCIQDSWEISLIPFKAFSLGHTDTRIERHTPIFICTDHKLLFREV